MNLHRSYKFYSNGDASGRQTYDDDDEAVRRFSTTNNVEPESSHAFAQSGVENISRLFTPTGFGSATDQRRNDGERILYNDGSERDVVVVDESSSSSSLSLSLSPSSLPFSLPKHRFYRNYPNGTVLNRFQSKVLPDDIHSATMPYSLNWIFNRVDDDNNRSLLYPYDELWNISSNRNESSCAEIPTDQYVMYGIIIPIIASIGILVNLASLIVLTRKSMRSSINMYLAGLSFFDGFLLLTSISLFPAMIQCELSCSKMSAWCQYMRSTAQLTYPLINITQTGSIWTLTAITVDRFIAITWPLKSRDLLTVRRALAVLTVIAIWSLAYNIPIFFELEFKEDGDLGLSTLRSPSYVLLYKGYCYLFFMFLIPAILMIVLNVFVVLAVRRAYRVRRQLSGRDEKERRCTLMAVLVVGTFLVLNLTANVTNCVEAFTVLAYKSLVHIGNLLVTLNSATNFFIYCALSLRFRQMFCKLFCPICYTPEKEYQFLSAYFGSGRPNTMNTPTPMEHGGIISMRSLRRPLISSPCPGPQRQSQQSRNSNSSNSVGNVVGGGNPQSTRKPTMKVDFSQRNKNLVTRRPPAYD